MAAHSSPGEAVLALRAQFDSAFAQAPQAAGAARANMLALRVGGDPYALYLDQVAGLYVDRRIMALPTPVASLLGVTGFRGQITPVHDLAALLGHERSAAPRWMVLVRGAQPLALAFEQFESHFSAPADQITQAGGAGAASFATVQGAQALRPVIPLLSLLADIQQQAEAIRLQRSVSS